jgi:hypothetical protein
MAQDKNRHINHGDELISIDKIEDKFESDQQSLN